MNSHTRVPLTGVVTLELDWSEQIAAMPGPAPTLSSAAWILPTGFTEQSKSTLGNLARIQVETSGLELGSTHELTCTGTFSNGDTLPAAVPVIAQPLSVRVKP